MLSKQIPKESDFNIEDMTVVTEEQSQGCSNLYERYEYNDFNNTPNQKKQRRHSVDSFDSTDPNGGDLAARVQEQLQNKKEMIALQTPDRSSFDYDNLVKVNSAFESPEIRVVHPHSKTPLPPTDVIKNKIEHDICESVLIDTNEPIKIHENKVNIKNHIGKQNKESKQAKHNKRTQKNKNLTNLSVQFNQNNKFQALEGEARSPTDRSNSEEGNLSDCQDFAEKPDKITIKKEKPRHNYSMTLDSYKDFGKRDLSFAYKNSMAMPRDIETTFLEYTSSGCNGLKKRFTPKELQNIETYYKSPDVIRLSDYYGYEQKNLYDKLISALQLNKKKRFEDDYFPPNFSSQCMGTAKKNDKIWSGIKWFRLKELYTGYQLVQNRPKVTGPCDVVRGYFDDTYITVALSAIAEFPGLIDKIFENQDYSGYGVYKVNLFDNGVPYTVVIDDYIPCVQLESGVWSPAFSQPRINQTDIKNVDVWVHLIIKAWAKLVGCYERIVKGKIDEFLTDLMGGCCEEVHIQRPDIFSVLNKSYELGYIQQCVPSEERLFTLGVESNVWCSVVRVAEVQIEADDQSGLTETIKLVKLRNPWNSSEFSNWHGNYSVHSSLWTKKQMDGLNKVEVIETRTKNEESCFWVDETEFIDLFTTMKLCHNFNNEIHEFCKLRHTKNNFSMVFFSTRNKNNGVLSLRQLDSRKFGGFEKNQSDYKYSMSRLLLCFLDRKKNTWKLISSNFCQGREQVMPITQVPGYYMAICQAEWKTNELYDQTLRWNGYFELSSINRKRLKDKPNFLKEVVVEKVKQQTTNSQLKAIDADARGEWTRVYFADSMLWVDVIRNNSEYRSVDVQQYYEGSYNIETDSEDKKNTFICSLTVEPKSFEYILYRATDKDCDLVVEEPSLK